MKKFIPFAMPIKDRQTISAETSGWFVLLILLCVFLTNIENARARDSKASVVAPGKTGTLNKEAIMAKAASIAVPFVKNVGQFNAEVKYAVDLFAGRFFLTGKELVYSLRKRGEAKIAQPGKGGIEVKAKKHNAPDQGIAFREFFVDKKGAKINFKSAGEQKAKTVVSYFKGKDAGKWRSGVASYQSVSLGEVYPGVEVKLKASGKNVEKIFYVSPQSNVDDIKIGVSGVAGLKIAKDGRLMFKNALGELAMRTPIAWQEIGAQRHDIKVGYRLLGDHLYGFAVMEVYNRNYPLIIDPELDLLLASTYLGGDRVEEGNSLALDSTGNVYLTGSTGSSDFPTTSGVYDLTYNDNGGDHDVFVSKLNSSLTTLLASTYLGGSYEDKGNSLALDNSGNVYLTGVTISNDFPTTPGVCERNHNGHYDAFVSKLNIDLTELIASTYLGGSNEDRSEFLALDRAGAVYLTGLTYSMDFPTTLGSYDRSYNGSSYAGDVFVSKLNENLNILLASTFLGGKYDDEGSSLALDRSGNVYVTGNTLSTDFPTTPEAYDRIYKGGLYAGDVFVSKLNENLNILLASTFLGGKYDDEGSSLALDRSGNVYVTGNTSSDDFPITPGAYERRNNGFDIFVSKLNSSLTTMLASTFLGGTSYNEGSSLALDSLDNVYLTGWTYSLDFPTTPGAYDRSFNGGLSDVFVSKLNSDLTTLLASTFLGGSKREEGYSLALDSAGNVYLTGDTISEDFPTTSGVYDQQSNCQLGSDVIICELNNSLLGEINLDLLAERREARAFSILRQYGQIQFMVETSDIPVTQYRIMRRQGSNDFALLRTITPPELQNNQFEMQDKYLEKDIPYTYRVEAYDISQQLIGISLAKTI